MQALLGIALIVGTLVVTFALTPRAGEVSGRRSGFDASVGVVGSGAIMAGLAAIISHLAGW